MAENKIMLFTSTKCAECKKFEPEWLKFISKYIENSPKNHCTPFIITHFVYDPDSIDAARDKKELLKYAVQGEDGFPLLIFYVNGKRYKQYWFQSRIFRTCNVLIFAIDLVYNIRPFLNLGRLAEYKREHIDNLSLDDFDDSKHEEIEKAHEYLLKWPIIKKQLQGKIDSLYPDATRGHRHYPTVDRILSAYL